MPNLKSTIYKKLFTGPFNDFSCFDNVFTT